VNTILPVGGELSNWGTGEGITVAGVAGSVPACVGVIVENKVGVGEPNAGVLVVLVEGGVTVDKPPSPSSVCVAVGCGLGGFCQI
jgi:hypothetical protein